MTPHIRHSITFALSPRPLSDGLHAIALTVTWQGQRYRHTLPLAVPPEAWDATAQLALPRRHPSAPAINADLIELRDRIEALFAATIPTPADLAALFAPSVREQRPTIDTTLSQFIDEQSRERSWQPGTVVKFAMLRRELHAAGLRYLDELDEAGQRRFFDLHTSHGLRNSTLQKKVAILHWFLRWCSDRHLGVSPSIDPHLRQIPRAVTYLQWDELLHLASFDYGHLYTLQRVRDIFCFCSFTGLRFSDASALRWQDIDGSTLRLVTQKTADRLTIPLNTHALAILDAYCTLQSPTPLPRISNQKANQYLKDAALLAGLDRETTQTFYRGAERHEERLAVFEAITTHWARRTFVVHALRLGIPAEVVMRFTGHSNYDAMRPYIDIVEEAKRDYMSRFDFGNSVGKTSAKN